LNRNTARGLQILLGTVGLVPSVFVLLMHLFGVRYHLDMWGHFWGRSLYQTFTAEWFAEIPQHLNLLFSWAFILRYWIWPVWVSVIVPSALLIACLLYAYLVIRSDDRKDHFRKPARIKQLLKLGTTPDNGIFAGRYGDKTLWVDDQTRAMVIGPPGSGKTAFLVNQIFKLGERGVSFVAADIKPEIANLTRERLTALGYKVVEFSPSIAGLAAYNPLDECADDLEIKSLVEALLPTPDKDPVWVQAEQDWLKNALFHLSASPEGASLPAAIELLTGKQPQEVLEIFESSLHPRARDFAGQNAGSKSQPVLSGIASVLRSLDWASYPVAQAALGHSDFQLSELGQSRPIALFLAFDETKLSVYARLLSALYGHIFSVLIRSAGQRQTVALFFDEIGNIPAVFGLLERLNTVRSRMMPTFLYWQTPSQMSRYGLDASSIFMGACPLKIVFRADDSDTRAVFSELAGKTTKIGRSVSRSELKATHTVREEDEQVVTTDEFAQLKNFEVATFFKTAAAFGRATPYFEE